MAEVTLSSVSSDHMVLQRGEPVHVWDWADAGERGAVSFRGHSASFQADAGLPASPFTSEQAMQ